MDATPALQERPQLPGRLTIALLIAIVGLAVFVRWHSITARGFFFDELWIAELSSGHGSDHFLIPTDRVIDQPNLVSLVSARPIWQVPAHTTGAIHPPGTFVMLRLWRSVLGDSMLALRSFSATWSVLVVLLVFVAARRSFNSNAAGLWAALISAISLGNVDQSQDVRGYTMLQALLLLTSLALLRLRGRSNDWLGAALVGIGTLAMMYTHYFAAGACAAIVAGAIFLLRGPVRWQTLLAIAVGGVVWLVTWLPSLRAQLAYVPETADVFLLDHSAHPLLATLLRAIASPYQSLVADPDPASLVIIFGGAVLWGLLIYRIAGARTGRRVAGFWLAAALGAMGVLLAIDLVRQSKHLEYPKYLQLMNPALCVLLGSLATRSRPWLLPALVYVGLFFALIFTPYSAKPDYRPQVEYLRAHAAPGDLFLLPARPDRPGDAQTRYLSLAHGLPWPSHLIAIPRGPMPIEWINALPHDRRWFVFCFADYDPATWQGGLTVLDRGPISSGVAVYEVRPSTLDH